MSYGALPQYALPQYAWPQYSLPMAGAGSAPPVSVVGGRKPPWVRAARMPVGRLFPLRTRGKV